MTGLERLPRQAKPVSQCRQGGKYWLIIRMYFNPSIPLLARGRTILKVAYQSDLCRLSDDDSEGLPRQAKPASQWRQGGAMTSEKQEMTRGEKGRFWIFLTIIKSVIISAVKMIFMSTIKLPRSVLLQFTLTLYISSRCITLKKNVVMVTTISIIVNGVLVFVLWAPVKFDNALSCGIR